MQGFLHMWKEIGYVVQEMFYKEGEKDNSIFFAL